LLDLSGDGLASKLLGLSLTKLFDFANDYMLHNKKVVATVLREQ